MTPKPGPAGAITSLVIALVLALQTVAAEPGARETLGPGDLIRVTVFQNPDLTTEARLSERGTILFPLIGEISLGGQTPAGAAAGIAQRLRQGTFMKDPQVAVAVTQLRSRQVSVLGQVARPGRYALDDANVRLTDILALAGGVTPMGDDSVTVVSTQGGKIIRQEIDLPTMYRSGDLSPNVEIRQGDMIFVQRAPMFYIYGAVQRAGAYRLESRTAVMQALSLGGGLLPYGSVSRMRIHRRMPDGSIATLEAKLTDPVQPDDVIYVRESLF